MNLPFKIASQYLFTDKFFSKKGLLINGILTIIVLGLMMIDIRLLAVLVFHLLLCLGRADRVTFLKGVVANKAIVVRHRAMQSATTTSFCMCVCFCNVRSSVRVFC